MLGVAGIQLVPSRVIISGEEDFVCLCICEDKGDIGTDWVISNNGVFSSNGPAMAGLF